MRCFLCVFPIPPFPPFYVHCALPLEVGLAATCYCGTINPYVTIGFCHPYEMDESTFIFGQTANCACRPRNAISVCCSIFTYNVMTKARVFYLSFHRPSRLNFLEIEKKKKKKKKRFFFFFNFFFYISLRLMPVQYWSSVMFFRFVFSIAVRLIKLPPVTAPGEILP